MLSDALRSAVASLASAASVDPGMRAALREHLMNRAGDPVALEPRVGAAADAIAKELPAITHTAEGIADLTALLSEPDCEGLLAMAAALTWRSDIALAPLFQAAASVPGLVELAKDAARARVVEGPLLDALACVPLLGGPGEHAQVALPENAEARARLDILVWEAGARALETPALGAWIFSAPESFAEMVDGPAHGSLRGRVLAARCLEISVRGMNPAAQPELVGKTLQVLQPLLLHPEPLVWVHAARALGRLTGVLEQLEGTLLD